MIGGGVPVVARWLLARCVPPEELEAVEGDLLEEATDHGHGRLWLVIQAGVVVLGFVVAEVGRRAGAVHAAQTVSEIFDAEGVGMEGWLKDLKVSVRSLARRPGFSAIIIATLALGIGVNTAIFSILRGAVLFNLPYDEPSRVMWHSDGWRESGGWGSSQSLPNLLDIRDQASTLADLEAYGYRSMNLAEADPPERALGLLAGPAFLSILGVHPVLGREFTEEDNLDGAPDVVLLTHGLWQERFGGGSDIVGSTVDLDGTPFTVIGVLPESFEFRPDPRLLMPLKYGGRLGEYNRRGRGLHAISRLADGATRESAQAEVASIFSRLAEAYPESNTGWTTFVHPIREFMVPESARNSLRLLSWAVAMVLLIACVNVANLLLVRSESRQRELAVRVAMGARRSRLLPVFLSESLLLGLLGGAAGVVLAYLGLPVLVSLYGASLPRADTIAIDGVVLAFAAGVSILTGLIVGILPALRVDVGRLAGQLKEGTRAVSRSGQRVRQALVVVEVALSVMLVSGAGLLLKSFQRMASIDTGLKEPEQVLVTNVTLSAGAYDGAEEWAAFFADLVRSVEGIAGVEAVGITNRLPLNGGYNVTNLYRYDDRDRVSHFVELRYVSPGFFDAVGIELLAGRQLTSADGEEGTNVVVTAELARQLFGSASDAVGGAIVFEGAEEPERIVGVVSDLKDLGRTRAAPPGIYYANGPGATAGRASILTIRVQGDPMDVLPNVRAAVNGLDPSLPVYGTRLLSDVEAQTVGVQRFNMSLFGLFAGLALLLGAVGIYGVMSYMVSERTRELGVRMALGARGGEVVRMIMKGALSLTLAGMIVGVVAALLSGRFVVELLYEVEPNDPVVLTAVVVILLGVAMAASYLPARRASSVNPVEALRHE